jgi:hypothetical protein
MGEGGQGLGAAGVILPLNDRCVYWWRAKHIRKNGQYVFCLLYCEVDGFKESAIRTVVSFSFVSHSHFDAKNS